MSTVSFPYSMNHQPPAPVIEVTVRRRSASVLSALLDTGADACIFPIDMLHAVGADYLETRQVCGITGHTLTVNLYLIEIQIGAHQFPGIRAAAAKPGTEAIIGRDVLNQLIVTLDGISGVVEIS